MYLCLSLGFKGNYRTTEFGLTQLEQITNTLYRRIRIHRGEISKTLAPYPIKATPIAKPLYHGIPVWIVLSVTLTIILLLFISLGYMLDTLSEQAHLELLQIGKSLLYDSNATYY